MPYLFLEALFYLSSQFKMYLPHIVFILRKITTWIFLKLSLYSTIVYDEIVIYNFIYYGSGIHFVNDLDVFGIKVMYL